jgi:CBS domain-containing protein
MTRNPVLRSRLPLQESAWLMVSTTVEIPVLDFADRPIGVITDRDIVAAHCARKPSRSHSGRLHDEPVRDGAGDMSLSTAVMCSNESDRRVPVIDELGAAAASCRKQTSPREHQAHRRRAGSRRSQPKHAGPVAQA